MSDYQIIQLFKDEMILLRDEVKSGNDDIKVQISAAKKEIDDLKLITNAQPKPTEKFDYNTIIANLGTSINTNLNPPLATTFNINWLQKIAIKLLNIPLAANQRGSYIFDQMEDLYTDIDNHSKFHKREYTVYMIIGGIIAIGGIIFLYNTTNDFIKSVDENQIKSMIESQIKNSGITQMKNIDENQVKKAIENQIVISKDKTYIFLISKILLILFIELIALAFFRYATNGLRYIQMAKNEQIAIKLKEVALRTALTLEDTTIMKMVIQQLFFTDKNFSFDKEQGQNKDENIIEKLAKVKNILSFDNK